MRLDEQVGMSFDLDRSEKRPSSSGRNRSASRAPLIGPFVDLLLQSHVIQLTTEIVVQRDPVRMLWIVATPI